MEDRRAGFSRHVSSADGVTTLEIAASNIAAVHPEKDAPMMSTPMA